MGRMGMPTWLAYGIQRWNLGRMGGSIGVGLLSAHSLTATNLAVFYMVNSEDNQIDSYFN